MKIAVIGAGIFGSTAAVYAARAGHEVHLFDKLDDLLQAASGINQYRLHRGYHYPRSSDTAISALKAEASFREEYGEAIINSGRHLYAVAKKDSFVTGVQFLAFCDAHGLSYTKVKANDLVNPDKVEVVIEADEARYDPDLLREIARKKLEESGVSMHWGVDARDIPKDSFDRVIIATYAGMGEVFEDLGLPGREYQYEVCEKPVVTLPSAFKQTDVVIMDGPFMCVDPYGTSGKYVLGNVVHAIHAANVGTAPVIPEELKPLLNRGVVTDPAVTRFDKFIETGVPFIPLLAEATHIGSMYTVRTVLPRLEKTDARPTLVSSIGERYLQIFSGKVINCVLAARDAVNLVEQKAIRLPNFVEDFKHP